MAWARSGTGVLAHAGNASRAARMARSISSDDECGSRAMVSPVAGSNTGSTWTSPPRASTNRPPTKVPTVSTLTGATIARPTAGRETRPLGNQELGSLVGSRRGGLRAPVHPGRPKADAGDDHTDERGHPAEHVHGPRTEGGHRRPPHHVGQGQPAVHERA